MISASSPSGRSAGAAHGAAAGGDQFVARDVREVTSMDLLARLHEAERRAHPHRAEADHPGFHHVAAHPNVLPCGT
jgi:hypothetical protein